MFTEDLEVLRQSRVLKAIATPESILHRFRQEHERICLMNTNPPTLGEYVQAALDKALEEPNE